MVFDEIKRVPMRYGVYLKSDNTGSIISKGRSWASHPMILQENHDFSLIFSIAVEEYDDLMSFLMPNKMRASLKVAPKDTTHSGLSVRQYLNLENSHQVFGRIEMEPNGYWSTKIYRWDTNKSGLKDEIECILGKDFPFSTAIYELLGRAYCSDAEVRHEQIFKKDRAQAMKRMEKYVIRKDIEPILSKKFPYSRVLFDILRRSAYAPE